jgi:trigger factor
MSLSMQVTETLSEGLKRGFTVIVPETEISDKREKRLAELSKTMQLPGFRPGKVPMSMVRKRYGDAVNAEIVEGAVNDASDRVLSERNLRPAMQPKLELVKPGQNSDLEFTLQLEILPDISLPSFTDIALKKPVAEVSEQAVTDALDRLRQQRQTFTPVETPRPAEKGEQLTVDFIGRIDGEAFKGGTANDVGIIVAGPGFIPGFSEQLEGATPGETKTIQVTFPEDYQATELAGKQAEFEITVKALNVANLPDADDELAKGVGLESLEALRTNITERITGEYAQLSRLKQKRALLDALAERAQFASPESLVDAEFAEIWRQVEQEKAAGRADPEDNAKDEETLKAEYRAIADRRVRLGLLVAEIGRRNEITVTDQDLRQAMFAEAMRFREQAMQVLDFFQKNPQALERFRGPIFEDKVVDYLLGQVQLEEVSVTPEELAADPEE